MCFNRPVLLRRTADDAASCLMHSGSGDRFNIALRAIVGVMLLHPVVAIHASLWNLTSLSVAVVSLVSGHHTAVALGFILG